MSGEDYAPELQDPGDGDMFRAFEDAVYASDGQHDPCPMGCGRTTEDERMTPEEIAPDLRISWHEFAEPLHTGTYVAHNFSRTELFKRGALHVEWDSPEGLFTYASAMRDDPGPENYDELRPILAASLLKAYEQAKAEQ